ncbi:MAG: hypothetical protein ACEY3E_01365 [Candidatus Tisiphia sp.]
MLIQESIEIYIYKDKNLKIFRICLFIVLVSQANKRLKDKSNLATHAINNNHTFPQIENMTLVKNIQKGNKMDIWENLEIFKHNINNKIIKEQTQIKNKTQHIPNNKITIAYT